MGKITLDKELNSLAYHGRGIIIGKSADGKKAVIAYFIMGRSENSRNRVFVEDGEGSFIHTYAGAGNPLPSFVGEPKDVVIPDMDLDEFTNFVWTNLNADNKVSLFTRFIDIATGKYESRIVNKNK